MDDDEKKEWMKKKIGKIKIAQPSPEKHNPEDHLKSILLNKYIASENKKIDRKVLNLAQIESVPVQMFENKNKIVTQKNFRSETTKDYIKYLSQGAKKEADQ